MKKLFVVSDVHGHYHEMIDALEQAGFDEDNENHLLVCLGDFTDRGPSVLATCEYLYALTKINRAVVLLGNHGLFLIEFLEGSVNPFNYLHNGLNETIADFWHRTAPFESWCGLDKGCEMTQETYAKWAKMCREDINDEYPWLLPWLKSLPRYFESEHYIGVHGAIDTKVEDWHKPHCYKGRLVDWDALDFNDGSFFGEEINNADKNVIIGHFGTRFLREMHPMLVTNDHGEGDDILFRDDGRVIAIDATTAASHKVHVLIVEDDLMEE